MIIRNERAKRPRTQITYEDFRGMIAMMQALPCDDEGLRAAGLTDTAIRGLTGKARRVLANTVVEPSAEQAGTGPSEDEPLFFPKEWVEQPDALPGVDIPLQPSAPNEESDELALPDWVNPQDATIYLFPRINPEEK